MATIEMSTDLARMITSVLPIGKGGTGLNTALMAFNALAAGLGTATGDFNDTTYFITTNNSGATNDYYRRSYSILKGNIKTYLTPNIITSIAYSGNGNAVTALSLSSAGVLTVTKGATYNNYSLPLAASNVRGGVKIGYTTDATNRNYAVQLSNEQMYVNVPWTETATNVTGIVAIGHGGTGATTAVDARTNLGLGSIATYGAATAGTKDTWGLVPVIGASDGVMEVGKYIDFHSTDGNIANYDVRIEASTSGLTISGTTTGKFSGNLTGNVTGTATKATQDGAGNVITSKYVTLDTEQTISGLKHFTGNLLWGTSNQGGTLYGNATDGGINSMSIGNDIYLGDCNAAGILGLKSTSTNCGFYFYNSSGTLIGLFYNDGSNFYMNKSLRAVSSIGVYNSNTYMDSNDVHASRYVYTTYINQSCSVEDGTISCIIYDNGDGWLRKTSYTHLCNTLLSNFLRYNGWWDSNNGQNINNALGMTFTYTSHGAPAGWGTTVTFEYLYNSNYRLLLHGEGYNGSLWWRSLSTDRGSWTTWLAACPLLLENGYYGLKNPTGANDWIRTTNLGIIPYLSGGAGNGHSGLGTSSWYFSYLYVDNSYAVHARSSNRAYFDEWIEFSGATGLYCPNANGAHWYPNVASTYGTWAINGSRGGYKGILIGDSTAYMNIMDNGNDKGLFQEGARWLLYYNKSNDRIGIYDSSVNLEYNILLNGRTGIYINSNPSLHCYRTDAGETSIFFSNNTAGWAIGINVWSIGAGQFGIGQYSGTGSSACRFRIDNSGYCYTGSYLNLGAGNENNASSPPVVWGLNGGDNFLRTYQTTSLYVKALASTGYGSGCMTYYLTSGAFDGNSDWCHYIICNHGDGASYYHYTLGLPFWGPPKYRRQTGSTSSVTKWYKFWTEENLKIRKKTVSAGSSSYHSLGLDATRYLVLGVSVVVAAHFTGGVGTYYNCRPFINYSTNTWYVFYYDYNNTRITCADSNARILIVYIDYGEDGLIE